MSLNHCLEFALKVSLSSRRTDVFKPALEFALKLKSRSSTHRATTLLHESWQGAPHDCKEKSTCTNSAPDALLFSRAAARHDLRTWQTDSQKKQKCQAHVYSWHAQTVVVDAFRERFSPHKSRLTALACDST